MFRLLISVFLTVDAFGAIYKQFFLTGDIAVGDERV